MAKKVSTRELGLILGARLMKAEDLHYGYWPDGLEVTMANMVTAQTHYSEYLIGHIPEGVKTILDVGVGTGNFAQELTRRGYQVEGISPSPLLTEMAVKRLGKDFPIHQTTFEAFSTNRKYDLVLFSESFQYIPFKASLPGALSLVDTGGYILIADFFRVKAAGESALRGGHDLARFQEYLKTLPCRVLSDEDITRFTAPNLKLMDEWLTDYVQPIWEITGYYMVNNHPWLSWMVRKVFGRKLRKLEFKYLSRARNAENFSRYKSYRCLLLQKAPPGNGAGEAAEARQSPEA